jgi:hypothetical protein
VERLGKIKQKWGPREGGRRTSKKDIAGLSRGGLIGRMKPFTRDPVAISDCRQRERRREKYPLKRSAGQENSSSTVQRGKKRARASAGVRETELKEQMNLRLERKVLRNGSKAGGVATQMDLRTRRNLKQQSQRPSLQTEQRRARRKRAKRTVDV